MTDGDDEQLLADALRAKASQSGGIPVTPTEQTDELPRVSGPTGPLTSWWILLLAILLGLATGAVIGLLTVL